MKSSKLKIECRKSLTSNGKYVSIDNGDLKLDSLRLTRLKVLVESGHIEPVLDKTYPLDEITQAHAYAEKGHKKGGVAITVSTKN